MQASSSMGGMQASQQPQQSAQSLGGMQQQLPWDQIDKRIADQSEAMRRQAVGQQILSDFNAKLKAAETKYPDFEKVVSPLRNDMENNPDVMAHLLLMTNSMDNTADIVYDLAKNPHKVGSLIPLTHTAPNLAMSQLTALSNSIKQNQQASAQANPVNEPLNQLKPSTVGTDNGSTNNLSVSDFKKMSWLKG